MDHISYDSTGYFREYQVLVEYVVAIRKRRWGEGAKGHGKRGGIHNIQDKKEKN